MYTTQERVEAYLKRDLIDSEVSLLDESIASVSELINAYCNREWLPVDFDGEDAEASVRVFDGKGGSELFIDDFISIEDIKFVDSMGSEINSITDLSFYSSYPLNKTTKQSIQLKGLRFPSGSDNIEVNAVWGSGIPPVGVVTVCTALVANFFSKAGEGLIKSEQIEGYSYTKGELGQSDEDLYHKLDIYKKFTL